MNIKELADSAAMAVKDYIAKTMEIVKNQLEPLPDLIKTVDELDKRVSDIASRPMPEKGEPGVSIDIDDVRPIIAEEVSKIPAPKDGKDAIVDIDLIKSLVAEEVVKIPAPKDGQSVTIEDVRPLVKELVDAIPQAQDGRDGLDALDIEILPAINDLKSYPRSVYARHNGGLWKSYKQTEAMDGWECVVDGIADISIDYDGERGMSIKLSKSGGEIVTKDFIVPMVIDRGVFKADQEYKRFDGVTYGGSYWIAQKDHPDGKPGDTNSDFRLSVKKGRDATTQVKLGGK